MNKALKEISNKAGEKQRANLYKNFKQSRGEAEG